MANKYYFSSIESTNVEAKKLAQGGASSGTIIWAGLQTGGRGRLGKSWHSVEGKGVYASLILRPKIELCELAKTTMVCGVALGETMSTLVGKQAGLKWPNDVFFGSRKCAGILVEASPLGSGTGQYLVVGLGVNVNQVLSDFPPELQGSVTSLYLESEQYWSLETLLDSLTQAVIKEVASFEKNGFAPVLRRWQTMDYLLGCEMEAVDIKGKIVRGISEGPDEEGILRLRTASGTIHQVLSGDIRLAGQTR